MLSVTCVRARNLVAADINGKSDPYVVVRFDGAKQRTKVCRSTLQPEWQERFAFAVHDARCTVLHLDVMDRDTGMRDDPLGHAAINLRSILWQQQDEGEGEDGVEVWVSLEGVKHGEVLLRLHANYTPPPVSDAAIIADAEGARGRRAKKGGKGTRDSRDGGESFGLIVSIKRARNLVAADLNGKSDPYVILKGVFPNSFF